MPLPNPELYTYFDYARWKGDERYELIEGVPYLMAPAPSVLHQKISIRISHAIYDYLKGKKCSVFAAPFDVRLNGLGDMDDTVVQPDLSVICNPSKLDEKGCNGAPDMVVEILSPSTARHDSVTKYYLYKNSGIREYWIVDPELRTIAVHIFETGRYNVAAYDEMEKLSVYVLDNCEIFLKDIFED